MAKLKSAEETVKSMSRRILREVRFYQDLPEFAEDLDEAVATLAIDALAKCHLLSEGVREELRNARKANW